MKLALRAFWLKCQQDQIALAAGHLSFISLLGLVPFFVISLSLLNSLPGFSDRVNDLESVLVQHMLPEASQQIVAYLHDSIAALDTISELSIVALFVIVFSLLRNVDQQINRVFCKGNCRSLRRSLVVYFSILLFGSILLAASFVLTSIVAASSFVSQWLPSWVMVLASGFLPILLSVAFFMLLYYGLPLTPVKFLAALQGALLASLLFEGCKWLFNLYLLYVPTYNELYGSLAILPIFCLWLYVMWNLVLLGAQWVYWFNSRLN
ncbi:hypothetical protein C2869_10205 [Saccharobesus litoralis]|uniref:YihY family inner membrane protein n=1 Tax=Saccharobesus litoralis TaxID=2172099 RepID=A0A2S0VRC6_9ALTE|nr:YihY family inner membrane protein [Saccharobesus litoralis]AWB66775.1 hypothetical protein C2869_10205 [Saccharobesus litoralis]